MRNLIVLSALVVSLLVSAAEVNHSYASRAVSSVGEKLDSFHQKSVDWSDLGRFEMIKIGFLLFLK